VFFPIVGLVVGFVVVVVDWMLRTFLSQEVTSVLLVAVLAVASAGRQLDGFANTCDGLIGFRGREWAIATMRDRRLGSFGVAAIVFLLILKVRSFDLLSDYRFAGILLPLDGAPAWLRTLSDLNPLTYVVDAQRSLFAGTWHADVVAQGFAGGAVVAALGLWVGIRAMQKS